MIDSRGVERAYCEKPASTFSQRALPVGFDDIVLAARGGAFIQLFDFA
ncbi:MAG TPA: hypothetical protein VED87_04260 [Methylocystis sp.]|nr:hypothetical protein [Methylocystis sp.]